MSSLRWGEGFIWNMRSRTDRPHLVWAWAGCYGGQLGLGGIRPGKRKNIANCRMGRCDAFCLGAMAARQFLSIDYVHACIYFPPYSCCSCGGGGDDDSWGGLSMPGGRSNPSLRFTPSLTTGAGGLLNPAVVG